MITLNSHLIRAVRPAGDADLTVNRSREDTAAEVIDMLADQVNATRRDAESGRGRSESLDKGRAQGGKKHLVFIDSSGLNVSDFYKKNENQSSRHNNPASRHSNKKPQWGARSAAMLT